MKREELRNKLTDILSAAMSGGINLTQAERSIWDLFNSALPPAEGAEEILDKYPHSTEYPSFIHENSAIAAMHEFAILHAQQVAEKMVEDMRQKLFSMRSTKEAMYKLSEADRLMQYGYHDCINEMLMWTKKLSHD